MADEEPKQRIEDLLGDDLFKETHVRWVREYQPCPDRRWSFDLALPTEKLAVEVDGRFHGRAKQHVTDCEKQNWAVAAGWRILRYPASRVLTKSRRPLIVEQINRLLCGVHDPDLDAEILTGAIR